MKDNTLMRGSKSPHFVRRNWYWITFIVVVLLTAATLISLPYGIDYLTEQWLMSHGLEHARVEDVDFNPFTGTLVLHNVRAKIADTQVLKIPEARMRFSWLPLLHKRARIENLTIKDTIIVVEHQKKGSWRIGGLALALAKTVTDKPGKPAWGFTLNQLEILNSQVEHVGDGPQVKLVIERGTVSRLRTWDSEQAARMDLKGKINEGTVNMEADFFLFAPQPRINGTLKLKDIYMSDIVGLAPPYLEGLQGKLSINSKVTLKREDTKSISMMQQGTISLSQIKAPEKKVDMASRNLVWDGTIRYVAFDLAMKGKLTGTDLSVRSRENGLDLKVGEFVWTGQANYGKENQSGVLQANGDLGLRQVTMDEIVRKVRLLAMSELTLQKISAQGLNQIKVEEGQVKELQLIQRLRDNQQADDEPFLFSLSGATLREVALEETREISIGSLELSGMSSMLRRDSEGKWQPIAGLLLPVNERKRRESGTGQKPVVVKINRARIVDQGMFRLEDRRVSPPFKTTVTITEASLTDLDSSTTEEPSTVSLVGKIGKYTDVSVEGEITRFTQRPSFELVAKIDDLDLAVLSGYVVELIGYKVESGHLDADIEVKSLEGELDGKTKLSIRNAEVSPADERVMERFEKQLRVPLPTALAVLEDDNNQIKLKVPITGDIADPKFSFADAFDQALVKGMTKAAVSYLKYLFQPYGTMMTVVELGIMAGKKITALRLDPVFFEPGSAELSSSATTYVEKVAELMKERPQISIRLCGLATPSDKGDQKETPAKKKVEQPTKPQEVPDTSRSETFPEKLQPLSGDDGHLRELVRQRAEGIKEYLVQKYAIEDDRLLVCQPEYDPREDARPRVELLI